MVRVEAFDEENEVDLAESLNYFLRNLPEEALIDIKYAISNFLTRENEQVYTYSALVVYRIGVK